MNKHIHHDCIVLWAADRTLRVECYARANREWFLATERGSVTWLEDWRYRVLDRDGNVIAETPAPEPPRVRIPEWEGPAPVERIEDAEYVLHLDVIQSRWQVVPEFEYGDGWIAACVAIGLAFATEEDAQQWADFLNQKWEVVSDE